MSAESKAVFLSYASQDAEAARRIADALRTAGIEVWFDQNELVGGDAWDAKIRKQIKECALFVPIISAATQARLEGYFRLEWKIAAQRTHTMAAAKTFLLPVVIDGTAQADAHVPEEFSAVQWMRIGSADSLNAFCERVGALLAGGVARVSGPVKAVTDSVPASTGRETRATGGPSRRGLGVAIGVGVLVLGLVTALVLQPWRKASSLAATAPAKSAPATEAQQLVARARQLYLDGDDLNREHWALTEDLLKRALALDPTDASAWVLQAQVSHLLIWHSLDASPARQEARRQQVERARSLAPESVEVQVAEANMRVLTRQGLPEVVAQLQALARREPTVWQVFDALGNACRYNNQTEDAIRAFQRAVELSGRHPRPSGNLVNVLTRHDRFEEAEAIVAAGLAKSSFGRFFYFDALIRSFWQGDLAAAAAGLARWPDWLRREDRGAIQIWTIWLWSRQPEKALAAIQGVQRDYLRDTSFTGPRAVLTARAHEIAGHREAAEADWRQVIQRADAELTMVPEDRHALYWKAWALARLGNFDAARGIATLMTQRGLFGRSADAGSFFTAPAFWVTLGQMDAAVASLEAPREDDRYAVTRAQLEHDPAFEPLKKDPRYPRLLAAAPGPAPEPKTQNPEPSNRPQADSKSVAVLAFANLSDDKDNEYFSDGISEELLNVLAKIPGLKVSARTSAFSFKGKGVAIPEIAKQLGVAYVVEGSVRKAGNRVRITAQLIKASDGFHVWSDNFDRELKDIFAVQDEIAGLIAGKLSVSLGASTRAAKVVNPEAYRLLLEGRHFWSLRTLAALEQAVAAYNRALDMDPNLAEAHAGLADVSVVRSWYAAMSGLDDSQIAEHRARTRRHAERALALDPMLADPYAALGAVLFVERRFPEAEESFKRALALQPNRATTRHWYSTFLTGAGRFEEATQESAIAVNLDPLYPPALWSAAATFGTAQPAPSIAFADRALAVRPGFLPALANKAIGCWLLGRKEEAVAAARQITSDPTNELRWEADWYAIFVLRSAGFEAEAAAHATRMTANLPVTNFQRAFMLSALGRPEELFDYRPPLPVLTLGYLQSAVWDSVRDDPRFEALLRRNNYVQIHAQARAALERLRAAERR